MSRTKKDVAEQYNTPFSVALRGLMKERATTQEDLANVTGKKRQTVSQYVNGISEPGYDTLVKIADHFSVSIDYLLGRTKDRRMHNSVYDELSLSEDSITLLRLAHDAMSNQEKLNELAALVYGPHWSQYSENWFGVEVEHALFTRLCRVRIKGYAKMMPELLDVVLAASIDPDSGPTIINSFTSLASPDCRPADLRNIMSSTEYVDFKTHEISEAIRSYLTYYFRDYVEETWG